MKKMSSLEIREKFLKFFEENDHLKIKYSSIVPHNDPTLLFINSGMAPLKNYFLGREEPPSPRLCNFQPCIRTKDIDDVGDRHHLTLFEMMGSWSIGDYYKPEACRLAYKLLVDEFGFPPEKLYMTVYGGNKDLGIAADTESIEAWKRCGVPAERIVVLGDDNFWGPAGDHGPCGPCTEVFFDTGEQYGPEYHPGGHFDDVGRYIEIWNAGVFMEMNKNKNGSFSPLPIKSVDTGSGLERLAMVINGHDSVYDTDLLMPLIDEAKKMLPSKDPREAIKKYRMIADHMRATICIVAEGVNPSNEGQGYIPRRLIRKCVATLMSEKVKKINFDAMVERTISILGDYYPQLRASKDNIKYIIETEVSEFTPVVGRGLEMIDEEIGRIKGTTFSGKIAFDLTTTFGVPLEVIKADLKRREMDIDEQEFEQCWENHRNTSRVIGKREGIEDGTEKLESIYGADEETIFTGFDSLEEKSLVNRIVKNGEDVEFVSNGESFTFSTMATPFYGESGGQSGDRGVAISRAGSIKITDTLKLLGKHIHVATLIDGEMKRGEEVQLRVDENLRKSTMRNHSATHLLHSSLHHVLGKHAVQKGSLVKFDRLRFDFQHPKGLTQSELDKIEKQVNEWIIANTEQRTSVKSYEQALEDGAMALFGEKYDADVRVVSLGGPSVELCGGTHVERTGDIGPFIIVAEGSVSKGIRRIEALTGQYALELIQKRQALLREAAELLKGRPEDINHKIVELKKIVKQKKEAAGETSISNKFFSEEVIPLKAEKKLFLGQMNAEAKAIKEAGDALIDKGECQCVIILSCDEKSLKLFVWVEKEWSHFIKAIDVLNNALAPFGGKGGGKPHFAQGGVPLGTQTIQVLNHLKKQTKELINSTLSS